nr:hypothetical protein [uncultured Desulfobacter sp.]
MSSIEKRIENLEKYFGTNDTGPGTEAVIIYREDHSRDAADPEPVTRFSFSGQQIHREPGELYQDFETRALKTALELLPKKQPGQAAPVPVLLGNGSLQK